MKCPDTESIPTKFYNIRSEDRNQDLKGWQWELVPGIRNAIMVCRTDQSSHLRQNNQVITNFLVESQGWEVESLSAPYHPLIRWWWSTILSHRKSCMQVNYLVIWSGFRGLRTDWWSAHHRLIIGWSSYHPSLIFPQWSDGIAIKLVFPSQIWAGWAACPARYENGAQRTEEVECRRPWCGSSFKSWGRPNNRHSPT